VQLRVCNAYSKTSYPLAPTLFFEFHGISDMAVADQIRAVEEIAREHGAKEFKWAATLEERNTLWQARHNAYYAAVASRPGARAWTTDICVPISHLAECILETQEDLKTSNVEAPLVGHAGDGNFHLIIMLNPDDPQELEKITRLSERLVERALKFNGTCSGEHGVGFGKLKYLDAEHGPALDVMRSIKRAIDPDNLMNPGKLIPES
jgi:D-lactate dehydrogenase (cytochrome)